MNSTKDPLSRRLILAIVLAFLASGSAVALLGTSGWLIARAAEHPPIMYLSVAVVLVRAFGISRGVFRYLERLAGHDSALAEESRLRMRTYAALSRTTLVGRRRGDLLVRIVADVDALLDLIVRFLLPFASASLVILGTSILIAFFDVADALVVLTVMVLSGIVIPWLAQRASSAADARTIPIRGRYADVVHELNRAAEDLVAYDADLPMRQRLRQIDAELTVAERRSAWVRGVADGAQLLAIGVGVIAGIVLGANVAAAGAMPSRMIAVLALLPLGLAEVLSDLTKAAQTRTRARAALNRVDEILTAEPIGTGDRPAEQAPAATPHITLTDVTVGWPSGGWDESAAPVLHGVDLTVLPGERVALVGPSGVGKTTIAATILGLIPPLEGSVDVDGRVGYLAQDAHIFSTSVAENVRIGRRDATVEQVQDALSRAGLDIAPDRIVGEIGQPLSGGEDRRLALARLLVGRFDSYILDEPTEHIDADTAAGLLTDLWQAIGDAPTLVITHDPSLIAQCDRRIDLRPGPRQGASGQR